MTLLNILVALAAGFLGAIGIGGGSILIIYLTLFLNMPQLQAQGINLIFFIPCSAVGIIFHIKNKLINFKTLIPVIVTALAGVIAGYFLNKIIDENLLRKLFGVFLIILALFQLRNTKKQGLNCKSSPNSA